MPDTSETGAPPAPPLPSPATQPELTPELKDAIKNAKGSLGKKALYWVLGIVVAILGVVGLVWVFKGKSPIKNLKETIDKTKDQVDRADMAEKVKVAEAKGAEKEVLDKLSEIEKIEDKGERIDELNKLLQDY